MKSQGSQHTPGRGGRHPEALLIAMSITILLITGFQLYWLKDNYSREKRTVELRAQSLFRETVRNFQDSVLQLKLHLILKDSSVPALKRKMVEGPYRRQAVAVPRTARVINMLGQKMLNDSLQKLHKGKRDVLITMNSTAEFNGRDSSDKLKVLFDS
ncbi:MAG: hypothetical protein ACXWC7_18765, partial [Chitinophagaceae bacterium]